MERSKRPRKASSRGRRQKPTPEAIPTRSSPVASTKVSRRAALAEEFRRTDRNIDAESADDARESEPLPLLGTRVTLKRNTDNRGGRIRSWLFYLALIACLIVFFVARSPYSFSISLDIHTLKSSSTASNASVTDAIPAAPAVSPAQAQTKALQGSGSSDRCDVDFEMLVEATGNATQWCRKENPGCRCKNPIKPEEYAAEPGERIVRRWRTNTHKTNSGSARGAAGEGKMDVVFLGDSITERWRGVHHGGGADLHGGIADVFRSLFTKDGGGKFEGLVLGIHNDRTPQLLWRIMNGEMPDGLKPKVWWVLIGTNDVAADHCSPEAVLAGIIRVVEEIRRRKEDSFIVVNSILPRASPAPGDPLMTSETWEEFSWINERLRCYSEAHSRIEFHNSTEIFLDEAGTHTDPSLYVDQVHPSSLGYQQWGEAIVEKLKKITSTPDP